MIKINPISINLSSGGLKKNNIGSQKLAEKAGFERDFSIEESDDEWLKKNWVKYTYK